MKGICHSSGKILHSTHNRNRYMVTVIECIAADYRLIPPMYIYKEGKHLLGWHAGVQDKEETTFALFTKGWTDNKLGLEWVEQNIEKYTMEMFVPLY